MCEVETLFFVRISLSMLSSCGRTVAWRRVSNAPMNISWLTVLSSKNTHFTKHWHDKRQTSMSNENQHNIFYITYVNMTTVNHGCSSDLIDIHTPTHTCTHHMLQHNWGYYRGRWLAEKVCDVIIKFCVTIMMSVCVAVSWTGWTRWGRQTTHPLTR